MLVELKADIAMTEEFNVRAGCTQITFVQTPNCIEKKSEKICVQFSDVKVTT
jgi:hypothetical protein